MKPAQFVADANASGPSSGKPDSRALHARRRSGTARAQCAGTHPN
jgi:hypothetical protein